MASAGTPNPLQDNELGRACEVAFVVCAALQLVRLHRREAPLHMMRQGSLATTCFTKGGWAPSCSL